MSALGRKVMDLAEQQGLLDGKAIAELRRQVAESKFVVTPEAIAKVLVDHGHLTPFQARKLVSQALGDTPDPVEQRAAEQARAKRARQPEDELRLADDVDERPRRSPPPPAEDVVELELFEPEEKPPPRPAKPKKPASQSPPRPPARENPPPALDKPVEGSTADDFVELEAIDAAPHARGNRWKTDPPPTALNETSDMPPIDLVGPSDPVAPTPIDDLFEEPAPKPVARGPATRPRAADPLAADSLGGDALGGDALGGNALGGNALGGDLLTPMPAPGRPAARRDLPRKQAKNVWDSPLLLIGGGAL